MSDILRNPNNSELIHAIEYNAYEFMKNIMFFYEDIECEEREEYFKAYTGIPFPMANGVVDTKIPSDIAEKTINEIVSYFKEKKVPFGWVVGPSSEPKDLGELLIKYGLNLAQKTPGMACDLNNLTRKTDIPNLKVVEVENIDIMKVWTDVCITAAEWPKELTFDFMLKVLTNASLNADSTSKAFLAYYNGKPVATSYVYYGAGVAGIYNVGTLEEARNKGIGTAVSLAPLYQAKKLGYEIAILQSSEMGLNVYKRIGFKEYCKIEMFMGMPG